MNLEALAYSCTTVDVATEHVQSVLGGKRVRIVVDFHDQPLGRSKPNLRGKEFVIHSAYITSHGRTRHYINLWLTGLQCAIPLDHVEILE